MTVGCCIFEVVILAWLRLSYCMGLEGLLRSLAVENNARTVLIYF